MLGLVVVSLLVVAVVTLGACDSDELTAAGRSSDDVRVLDWERGTYEGVRLGDSVARLIRVIGKPKRRGRNEPSWSTSGLSLGSSSPARAAVSISARSVRHWGKAAGSAALDEGSSPNHVDHRPNRPADRRLDR